MNTQETAQQITDSFTNWVLCFVEGNNLTKDDRNTIRCKIYDACLQMAEKKDEQFRDVLDTWYDWSKEHCNSEMSIAGLTRFVDYVRGVMGCYRTTESKQMEALKLDYNRLKKLLDESLQREIISQKIIEELRNRK